MKPFEIGLTLTGSVSAGSYTAGVIDFLIEALDEWDKQKKIDRAAFGDDYAQWTVPWHDVQIKGLSGASGGGVTCGLIYNSIGKQIDPVRTPPPNGIADNNDMYNIWVDQLGIDELMSTGDLESGSIKSLLNGNALPDIAEKSLVKENFGNKVKRDYIADNLKAIITVTNLRGIPYWLKTQGIGANQVIYKKYSDYVKFELAKENRAIYPDTNMIPYDTDNPVFISNYPKLKAACLATCAFPAAFKIQPVTQTDRTYRNRDCSVQLAIPPQTDYSFLNGDGGILNTNPFELLHQDMLPPDQAHNPSTPSTVERSLIIVAPLDTNSTFEPEYDIRKDDLLSSIPALIGAIRNDALFNNQQICLALDKDVYSRFIIAPVRYNDAGDQLLTPAITGTSVATFGAFLSRDFREHDYFQGRRNAQQFLRRNFAIPLDGAKQNPIFSAPGTADLLGKFKAQIYTDTVLNVPFFPIIPLVGTAATECYKPVWPAGKCNLTNVENDIGGRTGRLIDVALSDIKLNTFLRFIKWIALGGLKSAVLEKIMTFIKADLKANKL